MTIIAPTALFCFFFMKRTTRKSSFNSEEFFERERQANSVRKQPIDDLTYINVDLSIIPDIETDNEILTMAIKSLNALSTQKIVNLSDYSNTELKFKYGVANLPLLTEYDQNYTNFCRSLFDLGKELNNEGYTDNAIQVLEYGVTCGTDLKRHYMLLADLYEKKGRQDKIKELISSAENIKSLLKNSLINDLKAKLQQDTTLEEILEDISLMNTPDNNL